MAFTISSNSGGFGTGIINNVQILSGSSTFSGNNPYISLLSGQNYFNDDFTIFFVNQKNNSRKSILFNCLESGDGLNKGFVFGYNDVGNLFVEYYNDLGWQNFTTDFFVDNKHSIYLSKTSENINIGYYDYFSSSVNSEGFDIKSNFWFTSNQYFLGKGTGNLTGLYYDYNTGASTKYKVDQFVAFNASLTNYDIKLVNSGFAYDYITGFVSGESISGDNYQGFNTSGNGVLLTGVTGWSVVPTGVVTDDWGNEVTGYATIELTGYLSGSGDNPYAGTTTLTESGQIQEYLTLNTGYIRSFYSTSISMLRSRKGNDSYEICYETGKITDLGFQDKGSYNGVNSTYRIYSTGNNIIVYGNGVAQSPGDKLNLGTIYSPIYSLENSYFKTGNSLDFTGFFGPKDTILVRDISGVAYHNPSFSHSTNSGSIIAGTFGPNSQIFFNGIKVTGSIFSTGNTGVFGWDSLDYLYSDFDYDYDEDLPLDAIKFPSGFNLYNGTTGDLLIVNPIGNFTGFINQNAFNEFKSGFNKYYTQVYFNGQFQQRDNDYVVSSDTTRLNRTGNFIPGKSNIFSMGQNENDLFLE